MKIIEAKTLLLLYRPGTTDADDPQIAEALALAKQEPELDRWLVEHGARQEVLCGKFRKITVPAGLQEQIISEQAAQGRTHYWLPRLALAGAVAVALVVAGILWFPRHPEDDTLAVYQAQLVRTALKGYYMDITTNDPVPIRDHFAQKQAPSDYVFPVGLTKATVVGCAVEGWQDSKISMICFRSGRPQPVGQGPDLWLFVANRVDIPDAPKPSLPQVTTAKQLTTAVWAQGDKVYVLELLGNDESTLRKFL